MIGWEFCGRHDSGFNAVAFLRCIQPQQKLLGSYLRVGGHDHDRIEAARSVACAKDGVFRRPRTRVDIVASKQLESEYMRDMTDLLELPAKWEFAPLAMRTEATNVLVLRIIASSMGIAHTSLIQSADKEPWTAYAMALDALDAEAFDTFGDRVMHTAWRHCNYVAGSAKDYGGRAGLNTKAAVVDFSYQAYKRKTDNAACENSFASIRRENVARTVGGVTQVHGPLPAI
jgi:hypothetical protein